MSHQDTMLSRAVWLKNLQIWLDICAYDKALEWYWFYIVNSHEICTALVMEIGLISCHCSELPTCFTLFCKRMSSIIWTQKWQRKPTSPTTHTHTPHIHTPPRTTTTTNNNNNNWYVLQSFDNFVNKISIFHIVYQGPLLLTWFK